MDITSYLLGKKQGGGGETPTLINKNITANGTYNASDDEADGYKKVVVDVPASGGRDWSAIGYASEPQVVVDGYNYAKQIYDNWDSSIKTMYEYFRNNLDLIYMPLVDTSNVTSFQGAFQTCRKLTVVPKINTKNVTTFLNAFTNCYSLYEVEELDFSSTTNLTSIFGGSSITSNLTKLGGFKNLGEAFLTSASANYSTYTLSLSNCPSLTHNSLTNVIDDLYDIATKGCNTQKLTLGSDNLAKLTAEEIAIATNKGWTVS